MVGLISLAATMIEDLEQGIVYSYLTNSHLKTEDLNNLKIYKFILTIFFSIVVFVQVKIWIFKVREHQSFDLQQTSSVGKRTFQTTLALITFNIGITSYWVFQSRYGTSEQFNNTLKIYVISAMNTFTIGIMWVVTTPKMCEYYKNELGRLNVFKF